GLRRVGVPPGQAGRTTATRAGRVWVASGAAGQSRRNLREGRGVPRLGPPPLLTHRPNLRLHDLVPPSAPVGAPHRSGAPAALASPPAGPHNPTVGGRAARPVVSWNPAMTDRPRSDSLELPVLPLRDVVVFPHMVIPLFVGRDKSIRALDIAMEGDKRILLVAQRSAETDDPDGDDLHPIGTLAQVLQLLKLPDGTIKVLVEGVSRVRVSQVREVDGTLAGVGDVIEPVESRDEREVEAIARSLVSLF